MKKLFYLGILTILSGLNIKAQSSGNALQFDGVDDYVDMGNPVTFDVSNAVTYEAWINPDTTQSGFIFNQWVGWQEDRQIVYSGNSFHFYLHNVFGGVALRSSPNIPLHQYTHVAATYDASAGIAMLYINGVFDTSRSVGSGVSNSNGNLFYGFNPVRGDFIAPFKGIIDEVRIWNIARTESEIQSTMNQTLNGNEAGLIAYWKFDEGTGTTTADATTNNNNGTISGATWVISGVLPVEQTIVDIPEKFYLEQNYPNPFNPVTTIQYSLPQRSNVTLKIYDVLGKEIAVLVNEEKDRGVYNVSFDASHLSSGVYFYRLQAGSFGSTKKMILLR